MRTGLPRETVDLSWVWVPYSIFKDGTDLVPSFDEQIEGAAKTAKVDSWDKVLAG